MSAPATSLARRRADVARWAACLAVVVLGHGVGVMALIDTATDASDVSPDTPVVMIELPESLVTTPTPQKDLPPGPVEEEESPPTPQQKPETKPPEPEAELALPMPEPPKPEPPAEEKHAAAPPAARTPPKSIIRWQGLLAAHIERFKRYPFEARARGEEGTATVAFTIDREGRLLTSRIVQSSGSATLDQETLAMLARAQPMPRPPEGISESKLSFVVPVRFNIR